MSRSTVSLSTDTQHFFTHDITGETPVRREKPAEAGDEVPALPLLPIRQRETYPGQLYHQIQLVVHQQYHQLHWRVVATPPLRQDLTLQNQMKAGVSLLTNGIGTQKSI